MKDKYSKKEQVKTLNDIHHEIVNGEISCYNEEDKMFILWCLLAEYKEKIEAEFTPDYEVKEIRQYAANVLRSQHTKAIKEMRDDIYTNLCEGRYSTERES